MDAMEINIELHGEILPVQLKPHPETGYLLDDEHWIFYYNGPSTLACGGKVDKDAWFAFRVLEDEDTGELEAYTTDPIAGAWDLETCIERALQEQGY